jgi:hypothetical protein
LIGPPAFSVFFIKEGVENMYQIYFKNYLNPDGTPVNTEQMMYEIPIRNALNSLQDPIVKTELGKAGSLEFGIWPKHLFFNCLQQMKTIFRVVYENITIFRGRVLTIDNTLKGDKKIHCEGDLAFLLDSLQEPSKKEKRTDISLSEYFTKVIGDHNRQMVEAGDLDKMFEVGNIPASYANEKDKFGSDSWETSMAALEAVQKNYGGFFKTRYENGTSYLDWIEANFVPTENEQTIEVGKNLIDIQSQVDVNSIFTVLIPVGAKGGEPLYLDGYKTEIHGNNKYIRVPDICQVFSDEELNVGFHKKSDYENAISKYGLIYKTQKFDNADTVEKLWEYSTDWIKNNYVGGVTSFTISALDIHHIRNTQQPILTGDLIKVKIPNWNTLARAREILEYDVLVTQSTHNLHNPGKNQYNAGIPNTVVNKTYGKASDKKGGGGGGSPNTSDPDLDAKLAGYDENIEGLSLEAWRYIINEKYNNDEYIRFQQEHPDAGDQAPILKTAHAIIQGHLKGSGAGEKLYNQIVLNGGELVIRQDLKDTIGPVASDEELERVYHQLGVGAADSIVYNIAQNQLAFMDRTRSREEFFTQPSHKTIMQMNSDRKAMVIKTYKPGSYAEAPNPEVSGVFDSIKGSLGLDSVLTGMNEMGNKVKSITSGNTTAVTSGDGFDLDVLDPDANIDAKAKEFISDGLATIVTNGDTGSAQYKSSTDLKAPEVEINKETTYVDEHGETKTSTGFVAATDFTINPKEGEYEVKSLKSKLLTTDELIADKASIAELSAVKARVDELEAKYLRVEDLEAVIARLEHMEVIDARITTLSAEGLTVAGRSTYWMTRPMVSSLRYSAPVLAMSETKTFVTATGEHITGRLVTSYTRGSLSTVDMDINYLGRN